MYDGFRKYQLPKELQRTLRGCPFCGSVGGSIPQVAVKFLNDKEEAVVYGATRVLIGAAIYCPQCGAVGRIKTRDIKDNAYDYTLDDSWIVRDAVAGWNTRSVV